MTCLLLLLILTAVAGAQEGLYPAGGKWMLQVRRDRMNDGYWFVFKLGAEERIKDGVLAGVPEVSITCGKEWRDTQLDVPVVIGSEFVEIRADGKSHAETSWEVSADRKTFFVKGIFHRITPTKEMLRASDYRVKFEAYPGHYFVARFSPAGIDRKMLIKACGSKVAPEK
jgi:hypothetical protein